MLPGYFCFCYSLTKHYQGKIYCILQAHSMFTLCLELLNTVRPQRSPFRFPSFCVKKFLWYFHVFNSIFSIKITRCRSPSLSSSCIGFWFNSLPLGVLCFSICWMNPFTEPHNRVLPFQLYCLNRNILLPDFLFYLCIFLVDFQCQELLLSKRIVGEQYFTWWYLWNRWWYDQCLSSSDVSLK